MKRQQKTFSWNLVFSIWFLVNEKNKPSFLLFQDWIVIRKCENCIVCNTWYAFISLKDLWSFFHNIAICNIRNWKLQFIFWRDLTHLIFISLYCNDKTQKYERRHTSFLKKKLVLIFQNHFKVVRNIIPQDGNLRIVQKAQWWWNQLQSRTLYAKVCNFVFMWYLPGLNNKYLSSSAYLAVGINENTHKKVILFCFDKILKKMSSPHTHVFEQKFGHCIS